MSLWVSKVHLLMAEFVIHGPDEQWGVRQHLTTRTTRRRSTLTLYEGIQFERINRMMVRSKMADIQSTWNVDASGFDLIDWPTSFNYANSSLMQSVAGGPDVMSTSLRMQGRRWYARRIFPLRLLVRWRTRESPSLRNNIRSILTWKYGRLWNSCRGSSRSWTCRHVSRPKPSILKLPRYIPYTIYLSVCESTFYLYLVLL